MTIILEILLVVALVKLLIAGVVLIWVFRPDPRRLFAKQPAPTDPTCMYCQSKWTHAVGEPETRWEDDALVLVTTYECDHCRTPFWHIERVPIGSVKV